MLLAAQSTATLNIAFVKKLARASGEKIYPARLPDPVSDLRAAITEFVESRESCRWTFGRF
jgi:hypothetical protein